MDSKNVEPFKNSWELTELSSQWNSNDYTLVNEDDKNDLIKFITRNENKQQKRIFELAYQFLNHHILKKATITMKCIEYYLKRNISTSTIL
jgi:hypothetical protein